MLSFLFALLNGDLFKEFSKRYDKHANFQLFSHADVRVLENNNFGEKILELKMFASKEDFLNHFKPCGSIRYIRAKDIVSVETFHAKNSTDSHLLVIYTKVKDLQYYLFLDYSTDINEVSKKIYNAM
jgi:hypothetical protein